VKVLHLGAGNLFGGVETVFVTLAKLRHITPHVQTEFALCFRGRVWDELTAAGVPVFPLGAVRISRPWTVWRARRRLRAVLADRRPDVVVVHSGWLQLAFAPVVRGAGVRRVFFAHGPLDRPSWLDRWAARTRPELVIANSRFTAATVPKLFPGVRTEVVYLPVRVDLPADRAAARAAVREEFDTPSEALVILTACRLEWLKGHTALLDALGRIRDVPGWVSWVVGGSSTPADVAEVERLKTMAGKLGIADRVRFAGERSDVPRLLVSADVLCQPNTGPESFGLAFVEALAAGVPVVTSAIGGAAEIVDDTCGVLTPPGDAGAVAEALRGLLNDPYRRRALGEHGPRRARQLCEPEVALPHLAEVLQGESA
jgi:glycosyltransferase involved in cell wall biosynthesis